jgi:hypothetical protein
MINQLISPPKAPVPHGIQELSTSLQAIAPANNETTQIITYALLATAMVGIFVYHYIKQNEACSP